MSRWYETTGKIHVQVEDKVPALLLVRLDQHDTGIAAHKGTVFNQLNRSPTVNLAGGAGTSGPTAILLKDREENGCRLIYALFARPCGHPSQSPA